jgi:hypothetical protein
MRIYLALIAVFLSICSETRASDLSYVFAYECNSVEINKGLVDICTNQWPELASRSLSAYTEWTKRNSAKANDTERICSAQLNELKPEEKEKRDYMQKKLNELTHEILENLKARLASEGISACN